MNKILIYALFAITVFTLNCSEQKSKTTSPSSKQFFVASWNVENLFDTKDDPGKIDEWFLPTSEINWTSEKLESKLTNLAKVISDMNDGHGPDILGVQEVEHKSLLEKLLKKIQNKKQYKIIHFESPDKRGIDNALIYNSGLFTLKSSENLNVDLGNDKTTRDILYCELSNDSEDFHIFVNHWPSRREGLKKSEPNRIEASKTLQKKIDEIRSTSSNIIIMGDFNDLPSNLSITKYLGVKEFSDDIDYGNSDLVNLTTNIFKKGGGTYKYRDHWNMLDQLIISSSLLNNTGFNYSAGSFSIFKPDYLIQKEGKYKGTSLPTFGGRKYLGGYSDHFAISAVFRYSD